MRLSSSLALATALALPAAAETFDCVINPAVTVRVGGPVPGLLDEVYVDQGDIVTQGQKLARLRSEVEATTLDVVALQAESRAEIEAQESRLKLAQQRLERVQEMVSRNIAPLQDLEAAEAETDVIARELAIAEMRQKVAQLERERAGQLLAQRLVTSPVEGVVVVRHLFGGEYLDQDSPVVTIARVDPLHVEAFLPVALYGSVEPGMVLPVTPDAPITGTRDAQVEVVDRVFDAASGTFGVRLRLDNANLSIPAGHRCRIEIPAATQ